MNLLIKTEERPKRSTIAAVLNIVFLQKNYKITLNENNILIKPKLINDNTFSFSYEVSFTNLKNIFLETTKIKLDIVSGSSSFIDYLIFEDNKIISMIEETKTDDSESRNTGVYQRASKFVFANALFPDIPKYILYTGEDNSNTKPSQTAIFGSKLLKTIGVNIVGKNTHYNNLLPFNSVDEIIMFKNNMRRPPASNVAILITKSIDSYKISGTLSKPLGAGNIAHDPNIGALTLIAAGIRIFDKKANIYIVNHSVNQNYIERARGNKFLYIACFLNIKLFGLNYNHLSFNKFDKNDYYYNENSSEKITTIFLHVLLEAFGSRLIYENHAGCERGYFYTEKNLELTLPKRINNQQLYIPDLVLQLPSKVILVIEGKKLLTLNDGIKELDNYDLLESEYIEEYYGMPKIERWVTTFGGYLNDVPHEKVLIHINQNGKILINSRYKDKFFNLLNSKEVEI